MAKHNDNQFTDFSNNISVGAATGTGIYRFGAQLSSAYTGADERAIYVRGDSLKYWNGTAETDITSGGSGVSTWDGLYDLDKSLTIDDTTLTFALTHATNDGVTFTGGGSSAGDVIQITNAGSGKDINGTSSTWSISKTGAIDAVSVTGDTLVVGDGASAGVIASSGNYDVTLQTGNSTTSDITIVDGANGDVDITLNGTGKVNINGTTETNTSLQVTNGDVAVSDGSLTITDDDNANSVALTNNTITTADLISVTSTSLTTGAGVLVTANGLTEGYIFKAVTTAAGLTTGGAFLYDDGAARFAVKADGATAITTGVNSTKALEITGIQTSENLVTLTSSGVTADDKAIVLINSSGNSASGSNQIRIAPSGTPVEASIGIEFVGASKVMQALNIDGDSVNNSVALFNGGGALAANKAVVEITADGTPAANTAAALRVSVTGVTATNNPYAARFLANGKDAGGLYIDSDAATLSAVDITAGGAIADNKAALAITADGTPAAAGSNLLRVEFTGTDTNKPTLVEIAGGTKDCMGLSVTAAPTTTSAAFFTSSAAIAANKGVLEITATGTPAANSAAGLRVDITGATATNNPYAARLLSNGIDAGAIYIDSDAATLSAVDITAGGAIADNKAALAITADGTPAAAGSNVLRVAFTGTDTNKPTLVEITGDTKDCVGLSVDADSTTLSTVLFNSAGAKAADKAVLEVIGDAVSNADSAVIRVEQTNVGGVSTCLALKQDDIDIPFITFETTVGVGNAIEAVGAKSLTTTHFVMVDIEGVGTRYFPVGTIA